MRNIFDQYTQPENQITHALMTALNEDRVLLGHFLHELVEMKAPADVRKLIVLEQRYPGLDEPDESDLERRGIPDGWIADEEGWCVFIECKVISKLRSDQIVRHRRTAERRGFKRITAVAIAPLFPITPPRDTVLLEWRKVYAWLRLHSAKSAWAACAASFLEIAEARLIENKQALEGTLTMFSGFPFGRDNPFDYFDGKRVLGLAMLDLRNRRDLINRLGMNPKALGRSAIRGRNADSVWDFLSLSGSSENDAFNKHPHLTLGITARAVEAMVTVPHAVNATMRRNIIAVGEAGFLEIAEKIIGNLESFLADHPGATPWFRGVQRRYPSQSAVPFVDAEIEFDLRTAIPRSGSPKVQPRWLLAGYGAFVNKENSNYQIQLGVLFRYEQCPEVRMKSALELVAKAWIACKPLVDLSR